MSRRNIVLLIHGYGEHIFRSQYGKLTQYLTELGWEVRNHIIREHWSGDPGDTGHSYYYDNFSVLIQDLLQQVYEIKEELADEDVRIVLVGKSLGGLISIRCLQELPHELERTIAGAVTIAPCLEIGKKYDTPVKRALAYLMIDYLGFTWFYSPFDELLPEDVTKQTEDYLSDPHILSRGVWASVAVATRNETFIAREKRDNLRTRLLILHGTDDKICECSASELFSRQTSQFTEIETYPDTAHDLLDEPEPVIEQMYNRIALFLRPYNQNEP
ncbi:hypothetical protein ACHWQZ_G005230 [Mnemiopsis leidyi]